MLSQHLSTVYDVGPALKQLLSQRLVPARQRFPVSEGGGVRLRVTNSPHIIPTRPTFISVYTNNIMISFILSARGLYLDVKI